MESWSRTGLQFLGMNRGKLETYNTRGNSVDGAKAEETMAGVSFFVKLDNRFLKMNLRTFNEGKYYADSKVRVIVIV